MKAFTNYFEGESSDSIVQTTDISGPSPPIVVALKCYSHDTLSLRWKRPLEYYRSIDFYTIAYKREKQHAFKDIIINASANHLELAVGNVLSELSERNVKLILCCVISVEYSKFNTELYL